MIQSNRGDGKGSERPEIVLWTATAIYKILDNGPVRKAGEEKRMDSDNIHLR